MRPPWTIWTALTLELWRLMLLTAAVLVIVISFAATVKPLADGKLGPGEALRFMLLAIPPMLQYALPFAACFGAVLAYHRMAQDNELTAARAGGVSYVTLLVPSAATGIVLAAGLWVAGETVIPRFLRSMQGMLTRDVAQVIVASVRRGDSMDLGSMLIYADGARQVEPEPNSGAAAKLVLTGVAGVMVDREGTVDASVTTSRADVWLRGGLDEGHTEVLMRLEGVTGSRLGRERMLDGADAARPGAPRGGTGQNTSELWLSKVFSGGLADNPKFMPFRELRDLPAHPERASVIRERHRALALAIAEDRLGTALAESLSRDRKVTLVDDERQYTILAGGLVARAGRWEFRAPRGGRLEVEVRSARAASGDGAARTFWPGTLTLSIAERDASVGALTARLELQDVAVRSRDGSSTTQQEQIVFGGLRPRNDPLPSLLAMPPSALLAEPGAAQGGAAARAQDLQRRVDKLGREVVAKIHERAAIPISCLLLTLCGAVAAMRLASALPLAVYAWCFFPGLAAVLVVNIGQSVVIQAGAVGLVLIWGGLAALATFAAWAYSVLARN